MQTITYIDMVTTSLSIIGASSIIIYSYCKRKVCQPEVHPLFHLACADLLASLFLLIGVVIFNLSYVTMEIYEQHCHYFSAFATSFFVTTFLLTITYSLEVFLRMRDRAIRSSTRQPGTGNFSLVYLLYIISWCLPLYHFKNDKCMPAPSEGKQWMLDLDVSAKLIFILLLILTIVITTIVYLLAVAAFQMRHRRAGMRGRREYEDERSVRRRAALYLLVFCFCWLPTLVLGILSLCDGFVMKKYYALYIIQQSQGGEAATCFNHLTLDTAPFKETLQRLHKQAEDDLARSSHILQLQIQIADKELQLLEARSDLKAFSSREDERRHKSVLQADRLQILLEEQKKENTILKTQLLQTLNQLYEREESLTTYTKHQEDSFLPEQFLECSGSPLDDEEGMLPDNMEHQEDSFLPEQFLVRNGSPLDDEEGMLPDNMEHQEDSFLPEQFLECSGSPLDDEEGMLPDNMEHQEDSFLPEQFLVRNGSPLDDEEGMLPDNMEHQEDSFLPEQFLECSGSPLDDEEGMLPDNMEHQEDSFLPEQFLVRSGSPLDDDEGMLPDNMEHQEDSFLPEQFLECSGSPLDDEEGMLPDNMEHQEDSFLPEQFLVRNGSPLDDEEGMLPDNMEHQEDSFLPEQFLECSCGGYPVTSTITMTRSKCQTVLSLLFFSSRDRLYRGWNS
uniref:G-protein coupled receptors family 1 profile domain-containing protein n=1 Tax=Branchiostoma floridae TaxID=7739 RepID=C3ZAQ6_BRAFL|eukprot:XP_002594448.1 hypothetical protein BRAFLDRAFT_72166 [Branchiostoma floridae]